MLIFYFIVLMLLPVLMLGIGRVWEGHPPKTINGVYGYRTVRSMKSQETWEFAHRYFGKLIFITGIPLAIITLAALLLYRNASDGVMGTMAILVTTIQLIAFIIPIFPTEKALKRNFDEHGYPRSGRNNNDNIY
ncbi:MAG TPA: SdpI family protein [Mobilitalea sp.]|nr:SdpI family protein [Mobilitalea sp.]